MTRKELAKQIAKTTKMRITDAEKMIIAFGNVVADTMARKEKIVYSNFGTFYTVHYPSKVILHPILGAAKKMVMLPTDVVKWMPAPNIKELANIGFAKDSPTTHGRKGQPMPKTPRAPRSKNIDESETVEIPIKLSLKPKIVTDIAPSDRTDLIPTQKDVSIFEEMMDDGTKMESTFQDAIRVHKPDGGGFFNRVFKRNNKTEEDAPILVDSNLKNENPIEPFQVKTKPSYHDIENLLIPPSLLEIIPAKIALLYELIPIQEDKKMVEIATTDPENNEAIELIKKLTGKDVVVRLATKEAIHKAQKQYPPQTEPPKTDTSTIFDSKNSIYGPHDDDKIIDIASENTPSAKIVATLLRRAFRDKATSVQIKPRPDNFEIHFEIEGVYQARAYIPEVIQKAVTETLKQWANLDPEIVDMPQDGQLEMNFEGKKIKIGIKTFPEPGGEKIILKF